MTTRIERDYVLGTHDEEIARLGLQHRVWRPTVLDCWHKAGITLGMRVVDVGAGPGHATVDLAEIVGPRGEVLAVERSARFLKTAAQSCAARGLSNVRFQEADLMLEKIDGGQFDAAWCRWVGSFVSSPPTLVSRIAQALRPGGVAIFHEYSDYGAWRMAPRCPAVESFVSEVMENWRAAGGDPDVALCLPRLLRDAGLRLIRATPRIFTVSPRDFIWQWPASFIQVYLARLLESGRVTSEWAESVRQEFHQAQAEETSLLTTPLLLEIVAQRALNPDGIQA
jgi:ubiquinone/menaquinone biosynthesis C-methylase UbiE